MNMVGAVAAILSPLLIPYVDLWLPPTFTPEMRWRVIFTGLAGAWMLAAASWLFIDASRRLGRSPVLSDRSSVSSDLSEHLTSKPDGVRPRTEGVQPEL
jgi:hypothetical protein